MVGFAEAQEAQKVPKNGMLVHAGRVRCLPSWAFLAFAVGVVVLCLLGPVASARAATVTVINADDSGAGSLREAVIDADPGDTIDFNPSLSGQTIELTSGAIVIDKSLAIDGLGASELTIDGGDTDRIFIVSAGNLSISGLTLANGAAPGNGGAINHESLGSLAIADTTFTGNSAGGAGSTSEPHGGAIFMVYHSGSLTVTDSTFSGNSAGGAGGSEDYSGRSRGGAIEYDGAGSVTISGSTFTNNSAGGDGGSGLQSGKGRGGAIYLHLSAISTSVTGSTFANNTAGGNGGTATMSGRGEGGAIEGDAGMGPLSVTESTFMDNIVGGREGANSSAGAGVGGAIDSFGSLTVTNSTFSGNEAGGQGGSGEGAFGFGGAINHVDNVSPLTISGSTFVDNSAGGQGGSGGGGAISTFSVLNHPALISNSTLVGNAAGGGGAVGHGGAIEADGDVSFNLSSVTIDANTVGSSIATAGTGAGVSGAAGATARATIISGNIGAANCDAPVSSSSYSLEGPSDTSCGFDLQSDDPELLPLADNEGPTETQALPASSPAVDAVPVAQCPTSVDQRGKPRPDNGKAVCDVGAFELQDPPAAPAITSATATTFQVGKPGSFTVTATGRPVPDLSLVAGTLPSGTSFTDNGDGTASLAGTPAAGTGGTYPLTIEASNGESPDATQNFTLTVQGPPTVSISTPVNGATYEKGQVVSTSFACAEGINGPGLASCVDHDGRSSGAALDTAKPGQHTFTVTATSQDGLTGSATISYRVASEPKPKPPEPKPEPQPFNPSLDIKKVSLRKLLRTRKLVVTVGANQASKLSLTGRAKVRARGGRSARAKFVSVFKRKTVGFSGPGKKKVALALSRKGRAVLRGLRKVRLVITGAARNADGETAVARDSLTLRR